MLSVAGRFRRCNCASSLRCFGHFGWRRPPGHRGAQRLSDLKAGPEPILVKSIAGPGAAEPGAALSLDFAEPFLGGERRRIVLRMITDVAAEGQRRVRFKRRIEADEQRLGGI